MRIGDDSNEYPQHTFLWRIGENYPSVIIKYPPYLFYWSHLVKWVVQSEKVNMKKTDYDGWWYEPRHDKPYLYHMQTTKTQISLPVWEVWSTLYNSLHRQYNSCRLYTWKMWCRPVRVSPGRKPLKTGFLIRLTWEWYTRYVNYIRIIYVQNDIWDIW